MGTTHPREGYTHKSKGPFVPEKTVVEDFQCLFSKDVKNVRNALGISQEQLAGAVNCDARTIRYIEEEGRCPCTILFLRICGALGLSPSKYLEDNKSF